MPTSGPPEQGLSEQAPAGQGTAVLAESLYLANLLLLPGIAFAVLAWLHLGGKQERPPLATAHLEQTFSASLWAGGLLLAISALILALGGFSGPWVWTVLITYFTICHSSLVMLGILGLAKAMAGQCFRFPLVGRALPPECVNRPSEGRLL